MAINTLATLKTAIGVGARPNLFRVTFATGLVGGAADSISILTKSAALPGSTIGMVEIPHIAGRRLKLAGDRTFADWTMTVINDRDYAVRKAVETYQNKFVFRDFTENDVGDDRTSDSFLSVVTVEHLDETGTVKKTYKLKNAFITDISTIDLSYDSTDAIEEFTVTWVYDFYTIDAEA